ncbi:hypothetical protein DES41_102141 [Pseudorhodoferax soli]|uniref:Uncharacterized protein n=1 Tax=Pseudorhodoferax soli TaxID=545864 RepID=A0A368Y4R8_9BURK|nr:hypothetical protein DES41_102141 [Pseudorhodoferax soli]
MRVLHCLICAAPIEQRGSNRFNCSAGVRGGGYSPRLGFSIRRAVYSVDTPKEPPRQPSMAPYLWCPNCTAELEDYDGRERRLQCASCGLRLPATDQQELLEIRQDHGDIAGEPW